MSDEKEKHVYTIDKDLYDEFFIDEEGNVVDMNEALDITCYIYDDGYYNNNNLKSKDDVYAEKLLESYKKEALHFKAEMDSADFTALTVLYDNCRAEYARTGHLGFKILGQDLMERIGKYMKHRK